MAKSKFQLVGSLLRPADLRKYRTKSSTVTVQYPLLMPSLVYQN